jgi:hypothetical protein
MSIEDNEITNSINTNAIKEAIKDKFSKVEEYSVNTPNTVLDNTLINNSVPIEVEKKICKKCKKEIKDNRKVFCSTKCAKAFHSLKRYHKIKSTEDYKSKRRVYKLNIKRDKIILPEEQKEVEQ